MKITLRKARLSDSENILAWRNEPSTIPWMGTTRALSFAEHHNWFSKVIEDQTSLFLVIESENEPIGQIRYHKNTELLNNAAKVSINIAEKMHGKGIASRAFQQGSIMVRKLSFAENIFAYVQPDNIGSIRAMEKAGYIKDKIVQIHDTDHLIMIDQNKSEK